MNRIKKFAKIIEIAAELYEEDSKYFIDCFFNMYYQMKKKITVRDRCNGNPDSIKKVWETLNFIKFLCSEKNEKIDKAFIIACKKYKTDQNLINGLMNSFRAFKSSKKTKFKDLF